MFLSVQSFSFLFRSASSNGEAFMPFSNNSAYFSIALRVCSKPCVIMSLKPAKGWSLFTIAMFTSGIRNTKPKTAPTEASAVCARPGPPQAGGHAPAPKWHLNVDRPPPLLSFRESRQVATNYRRRFLAGRAITAETHGNPYDSADPSTVITVVAFRDHDPDRPLAASSVVPGYLLCATDIRVV